jgi:hypothetical protein
MDVVSLQNAMPPKIQNWINYKCGGKGDENLTVRASEMYAYKNNTLCQKSCFCRNL